MRTPEALHARVDGIVIGASAGGVETLSVLLPALPATLRAAVFIVVHLPRERLSSVARDFCDEKCRAGARGRG